MYILDRIVEDKKRRLKEHKAGIPETEMRRLAEEASGHARRMSFFEALSKDGISIIGEFKKASPSLGKIESRIDLLERMDEYSAAMDAVSCLTEEDHFLGSIEDLKRIRSLTDLPILRKDFMIDPYQFYEARAMGADAVLLITEILEDGELKSFYELASELSLDVLVEAHSEKQIERALAIDAKIIGVNNRDLRDFTIRLDTTKHLRALVPEEKVFVAESGIVTDSDVRFLKETGVDAFLIGRAFMEAENPKGLAERWKRI